MPGNIVGAIANEAGLDAKHIGHIDIHTEYSLVDLPTGMPKEVFQDLRKARVCGHTHQYLAAGAVKRKPACTRQKTGRKRTAYSAFGELGNFRVPERRAPSECRFRQ
jgi:hypothetical protein